MQNVISIHPPRAGRDANVKLNLVPYLPTFQSTRPVRGGTKRCDRTGQAMDISIHPPRAGRDVQRTRPPPAPQISIHPPRAGRDRCGVHRTRTFWGFQSTRPVRGGTEVRLAVEEILQISIHPPRAGRDGRLVLLRSLDNVFQSTRPVRGGTSSPAAML